MSDLLDDWDFDLPDDRIARHPAARRDGSRLLHVPRTGSDPTDHRFTDLVDLLRPGDLLVVNDARVMASRVRARRSTGGRVELLLLQPGPGAVEALAKPARRLKVGECLEVEGGGTVEILARPDAEGVLRVRTDPEPAELMARVGELPLPPYLGRTEEPEDRERYQTVYAGPLGAAAAPTAGLHFTEALFDALRERGIGRARVTLHVGLGTFRPLRPEDVARGTLHRETYVVPEATAAAVHDTRARGGRVIAVGTTSARTLEAAWSDADGRVQPGPGHTELFIQPPYTYRALDGLITNFHLPRSSLLMMVASLIDRERLLHTYRLAIARGYRLYSYGDAMLLL